jgi:hypothetical protein
VSDFVVYHNPDSMGYPAEQVDTLSIVTDKSANTALGSRIWLITGEGTPRTFYLCGWFTATSVGPDPNGDFNTVVEGTVGVMLRKKRWPILNHLPWFPPFKENQGNFAFGFQPINQRAVVQGLEALIAKLTPPSPSADV